MFLMKNKISETEKCLISIRMSYLRNEYSFSTKIFFTLLSIFIGFVYFIIKSNSGTPINEGGIAIIVFGVLIFFLQMYKTNANLKRMYNGIMGKVIHSKKLEDYMIEKDTIWDRILVGLSGAYFLFVLIIIISKSFIWSFIISLVFAIILFLSRINYKGD